MPGHTKVLFKIAAKKQVYFHDHLIEAEGFGKVIVCAKGGRFAVADIHGCDDQDWRLREFRVGAQLTAQLEAVWWGHHQVEDEKIGMHHMRC